jgi:phage terminase large subunit GpA-like protein
MARCEVCGNDYDKSFTLAVNGKQHIFDSFECAIHALAPQCAHCNCRIIGHGVEGAGQIYCCANCARQAGIPEMADRAA